MKSLGFVIAIFLLSEAAAQASDLSIPDPDVQLIKTADQVEVSGTNDLGGAEDFTIQDRKAIAQFIEFLTSERFTTAPKSLKPQFKSLSSYRVRLSSKGAPVMELRIVADSILDFPGDPLFYVEGDDYSDNLMAPLLRLR